MINQKNVDKLYQLILEERKEALIKYFEKVVEELKTTKLKEGEE